MFFNFKKKWVGRELVKKLSKIVDHCETCGEGFYSEEGLHELKKLGIELQKFVENHMDSIPAEYLLNCYQVGNTFSKLATIRLEELEVDKKIIRYT